MLKLYGKMKPLQWICLVIIIGLTILQVYCTMSMIDYISGITTAVQYLGYKSDPSQLASLLPSNDTVSVETMIEFIETNGWDGFIAAFGITDETILTIANTTTTDIWYNGGMMLAFAAGSAGCQIVVSVISSYIAARLATDIRTDVNKKISGFSLAELSRFSTASLVTRATNDIQNVQMTTLTMMRMVFVAPVMIIWAICKVQSTSWQLTTATVVAVVLLLATIIILMTITIPKFKKTQKLTDKVNSITQENLTGIRVVRAFNAEKYQEEKFDRTNEELTGTMLFTGRAISLLSPGMTIIMNGLTLAIYWIGAYLINGGVTNFGDVISFTILASQIVMSFVMVMMMFILLPRAQVCAERINEVLETEDIIRDPETEVVPDPGIRGSIEFRDVSFRYPDAEECTLEHISFKAEAGQTVAFIGSTGSGKSTLVNLVTRLYDVTDGQILIDGVDIRDMKQSSLRARIGFVPQKGLLFSGTVRSNIAFGDPSISDEKVHEAAEVACADEFIEKMEQGYDSPIARGGTNVSGGQKQRLCIARAVAISPEFFVFDDSFSALDYKTDKQVRANLGESQAQATKMIVAQRIGTIMDADLIVVLADGKVVGEGTHRELLNSCDVYREIALSQLSREELGI